MSKKKQKRHFVETGGDTLGVRGDLTIHTARKAYRESLDYAGNEHLPSVIDLSAVGYIDSAGLALLLEWQSWAHRHNHHFCFSNAPDHLMRLATLADAENVLDLHMKECDPCKENIS